MKNSLHYKQLILNYLSFKVQLAQVTTDFLQPNTALASLSVCIHMYTLDAHFQ